jgi:N-acetylneuraminic acid mutarotase
MSHSVAVAQSNGHKHCLYVIGGRSSSPTGISELHSSAFCYNPSTNRWTVIQSIGDGVKTNYLSASAGVALGSHQILMVGGDRGEIFHRIETYNRNIAEATNEDRRKQLQAEKLGVLTHHPGFSRQILMYDTLTDQWKKAGELPMESHVTTNALVWDGDIFITGGEVRPGIRTPDILKAKLPDDIK